MHLEVLDDTDDLGMPRKAADVGCRGKILEYRIDLLSRQPVSAQARKDKGKGAADARLESVDPKIYIPRLVQRDNYRKERK